MEILTSINKQRLTNIVANSLYKEIKKTFSQQVNDWEKLRKAEGDRTLNIDELYFEADLGLNRDAISSMILICAGEFDFYPYQNDIRNIQTVGELARYIVRKMPLKTKAVILNSYDPRTVVPPECIHSLLKHWPPHPHERVTTPRYQPQRPPAHIVR